MNPTTLQERLAEAEAAYHDLLLGRSVRVFVDQNGERIEYSGANKGALYSYIQTLKHQLGLWKPQGPFGITVC